MTVTSCRAAVCALAITLRTMVASARFRPAGQDRRRRHRLDGNPGLLEGNPAQVLSQLYGIAATLLWSGVITVILLKIVGR